jgi:hypothetical protein
MNIKPIKTKKDYQTALKQIEGLFGSLSRTSEGDRLLIESRQNLRRNLLENLGYIQDIRSLQSRRNISLFPPAGVAHGY